MGLGSGPGVRGTQPTRVSSKGRGLVPHLVYGTFRDPEQRCLNPNKTPTEFKVLWTDLSSTTVTKRFCPYLQVTKVNKYIRPQDVTYKSGWGVSVYLCVWDHRREQVKMVTSILCGSVDGEDAVEV